MISSVLVSWKRAATRYAVLLHYAPRIQCFQGEDPEGPYSDEGEGVDEEEFEDDDSLPSVDEPDGTRDIGILYPLGVAHNEI